MPLVIQETLLASWDAFRQVVSSLEGRWHFRGLLRHHQLESSLERTAKSWGIEASELPKVERRLLREFKRTFPTRDYLQEPARGEDIDWLALMQHHGAPTRLLDFTYSPFVAAFFALEMLLKSAVDKQRPAPEAAVWALSVEPVANDVVANMIPAGKLRDHFTLCSQGRTGASFRPVFLEADPRLLFVTPVNPFRLNERLTVQQGLFLCPGDVSKPFESNLEAVEGATDPKNIKKLVLPRSVLQEGFAALGKMNISAASLFPGVDGFARSLCHKMEFLRTVPLFDGADY